MEETVPGASVFPTRTRPDATQTGNAAADDLLTLMKITRTAKAAAANSGTFTGLKVTVRYPFSAGEN
jgi:hypothetical protein